MRLIPHHQERWEISMGQQHTDKPGKATFKLCRCCGSKAKPMPLRKRVCPVCKVPAIWDAPTAEQIAAYEAENTRREALIQELSGDEL